MTQGERAEIIKKILKWIIPQEKGVTTQAIYYHIKWEITEGGASNNSIKKYIEDISKASYITYEHPFWKATKAGKDWLERHSV